MGNKKIKVGDTVKGEVTGVTEYGVFVNFQDDYSGMVHISEVSEAYVKDMEALFKIGDTIKVKILEVDDDKKQTKLSIKKLQKLSKKNKINLEERGTGFDLLEENLEKWTKEKIKEIENID